MRFSRRDFLRSSTVAAALAARPPAAAAPPGTAAVITPNGASLPYRERNGLKIFHLVAEPVAHEFAPGLAAECWGYNGRVHGPTIEAVEGDRVRIYVTNRLETSTSVHWHGLYVPNGMDGVGGLSQRPIEPGETFRYEFTLRQHGTFMYHSHHDEMTQMALGMMGLFVVHPRRPVGPPVDRDYAYLLSEWKITPGARRPDPNEMMDFNVLTLNAKIFPATAPIVARPGERVRIRFGNLSAMDHHPIHLHAHSFQVVATDGGEVPESARYPETTVLVPVGSVRVIEFVAGEPGDWALHCHMTHHVMTQMGHGIPNLIGVDPTVFDEHLERTVPEYIGMDPAAYMPRNSLPMMGGAGPHGYITMSGMFTVLQVRDELPAAGAPGWYVNPPDTEAGPASAEDLAADGIAP